MTLDQASWAIIWAADLILYIRLRGVSVSGGSKRLLLPAFCWSQVFPHVGSCPDGEQQATRQVRGKLLMLAGSFSFCGLPVLWAKL